MIKATNGRPGQREINSGLVLRTIVRRGEMTRVDLAHETGLTPAAISNITRELIERGLLHEAGISRGKRAGANAYLLDFPQDQPLLGIIHQGVSALRLALCNLRGHILARCVIATPTRYSPEWAVARITETLQGLLKNNGYQPDVLIGIGAALVGLIDGEQGIVKRAPSLGWEGIAMSAMLERAMQCPVVLENNVRAMAFGEALLGNGRGWSDFAFVYVGTGIGSGLVLHGRPYRGAHSGAGEIGHLTVAPDGEVCSCGNTGCLETIAAEPALIHHARQRGIELNAQAGGYKKAVEDLASLALTGDAQAREIIKSTGESLGTALANLVDLFNPARIVLHGAITAAGELFFHAVSQCISRRAFLARDEVVELVPATFGTDAGLVGAAAIALDTFILAGNS